jgi:hypothetical protein
MRLSSDFRGGDKDREKFEKELFRTVRHAGRIGETNQTTKTGTGKTLWHASVRCYQTPRSISLWDGQGLEVATAR